MDQAQRTITRDQDEDMKTRGEKKCVKKSALYAFFTGSPCRRGVPLTDCRRHYPVDQNGTAGLFQFVGGFELRASPLFAAQAGERPPGTYPAPCESTF
jgi:hypothetical protein